MLRGKEMRDTPSFALENKKEWLHNHDYVQRTWINMRFIGENLKNPWKIPQTDLEGYLKHTSNGPEKNLHFT